MHIGLIDPLDNDSQNNNGLGNIPSEQDYEDLRSAQGSFALMAACVNGSTINVTSRNSTQRFRS